MILISGFVTIVVSIVLMLWIFKMKKDDPFPKFTVIKVLIGGWLSYLISSAISIAALFVVPMLRFGPADYIAAWRDAAAGNAASLLAFSQQSTPNIWAALIKSLIAVALVEELIKFVTMRLIARKQDTVINRFDAIALCALVGIGFQIFEDIGYAVTGGVVLAISRALMPFHFTFGAIMGYFYGKYKKWGKKSDLCLAIALPTVIHWIYDFSVINIETFEMLVFPAAVSVVALWAITVFMIVKIRRWSVDEEMRAYIAVEKGEQQNA